jgi:hypothetical protein
VGQPELPARDRPNLHTQRLVDAKEAAGRSLGAMHSIWGSTKRHTLREGGLGAAPLALRMHTDPRMQVQHRPNAAAPTPQGH